MLSALQASVLISDGVAFFGELAGARHPPVSHALWEAASCLHSDLWVRHLGIGENEEATLPFLETLNTF